jgi:hypothetical protein
VGSCFDPYPQIPAWIAQTAELQRIAEPGLRSPGFGDRGEIDGSEGMVAHDLILGRRQHQQRTTLLSRQVASAAQD